MTSKQQIWLIEWRGKIHRNTTWVKLREHSTKMFLSALVIYALAILSEFKGAEVKAVLDNFLSEVWMGVLLLVAFILYKWKLPAFLKEYPTWSIYKKEAGKTGQSPITAALQDLANKLNTESSNVCITKDEFTNTLRQIEEYRDENATQNLPSNNIDGGNFSKLVFKKENISNAYNGTRNLIAQSYDRSIRYLIGFLVSVATLYFGFSAIVRLASFFWNLI